MAQTHSEGPRRAPSVVERIQELILRQGLRPGDPIPTEPELMLQLGVSRSSVREAIRTLSTLDIVSVRHGRGTTVGSMSMAPLVDGLLFRVRLNEGSDLRTLREVVHVRKALDVSVTDELLAAYRGTENPELAATVDRMRVLAEGGESFAEADSAFHALLLKPLDNELIKQLGHAFWEIHTAAQPLLQIPPAEDILDTVDAHQAMLDALEAGDEAAYHAAVVAHYRPLERVLAGHL
ncbi:MAG: GntR family transcriptional regulator [Brachybacterium sp.]|nr:GntR family transcriptional regulator [Brachybacterium sp.]